MSCQIDPGAYYTEHQLCLALDCLDGTIGTALDRGRLPHTAVGKRGGKPHRVILGADVQNWLADGAPTDFDRKAAESVAKRQAAQHSGPAAVRAMNEGATMPQSTYQGNATTLWNTLVDDKTRRGKSRSQAIRELARANPDLHAEYIKEANKNRPAAIAQRFGV